jgi:hypothetical protein
MAMSKPSPMIAVKRSHPGVRDGSERRIVFTSMTGGRSP